MVPANVRRRDGGCKRSTPPCRVYGELSPHTTTIRDNFRSLVPSHSRPRKFHTCRHAVRSEVLAQLAVVKGRERIREAERERVVPTTRSRLKMDDHLAMNLLNSSGHPKRLKGAEGRRAGGSLTRTDCLRIYHEYRCAKPRCFASSQQTGKTGTGNDQVVRFPEETSGANRYHVEV
ncbi:MAG: hypothetical protein EBT47_00175 [Chloroflexi bacterium]|nr:hypothetical protein [Chloroflexota bacterium]